MDTVPQKTSGPQVSAISGDLLKKQHQNDGNMVQRLGASNAIDTMVKLPTKPGEWIWNALVGIAVLGAGYLAYEIASGEEEFPAPPTPEEIAAMGDLSDSSGVNLPLPSGGEVGASGEQVSVSMVGGEIQEMEEKLNARTEELRVAINSAIQLIIEKDKPEWAAELREDNESISKDVDIIKSRLGIHNLDDEELIKSCSKITDYFKPAPAAIKKPYARQIKALYKTVGKLRSEWVNSNPDVKDLDKSNLKEGCIALRMYVDKILQHPTIPRYQRISVTNQNYKKLILPLEGHVEVLEAIGFKRRGAYFDWIGLEPRADDAASVASGAAESEPGINKSDPMANFEKIGKDERMGILRASAHVLENIAKDKEKDNAADDPDPLIWVFAEKEEKKEREEKEEKAEAVQVSGS